ncbi:hypothetical protein J4G48_0031730 [Bradyrhizobium barranii subsp. apii]|uniref:hypothetical protein n=1 Tax=Bradyrhizobium barranii TaxID=2992140 RepID=UPI001CD801A5|nr:hypothetical protein [Bradyrhizobium barranii]UPT93883.1 hypothetical protein J4G48_0031730 [Bradyrhizobium barranii subsp. apii]
MVDLSALRAANANRFAHAKLTRAPEFKPVAERLVGALAKSRYEAVAARTGVPWYVIAVIHQRECSQSWRGSLAQGDPWDRKSVHVPAGRGPFASWEDCAVDALVNCAPYAARNKDWSVGGTLTLLEQYNGLGYASRGRPSPYLWSGTDQYVSGKYVRDGVYDPNAVDKQLGCVGLILAMMQLDASIKFGAPVANDNSASKTVAKPGQPVIPPHPDAAPATPSITRPAAGSIGAWIAQLLKAFKKAA